VRGPELSRIHSTLLLYGFGRAVGRGLNLHSINESVPEEIDMSNKLVHQYRASQIADDLVDAHYGAAAFVLIDLNRLNVRIKDGPLTSPVAADLIVSKHATAFHAVWPVHIGTHEGENGLYIPPIECRVSGQQ
jgi:hypothetical protein